MRKLLDQRDGRYPLWLASLLGLSPEELSLLRYKGLREEKDAQGRVLFYSVLIDADNPQYLMDKLSMNEARQVIFTLEQVIKVLSAPAFGS